MDSRVTASSAPRSTSRRVTRGCVRPRAACMAAGAYLRSAACSRARHRAQRLCSHRPVSGAGGAGFNFINASRRRSERCWASKNSIVRLSSGRLGDGAVAGADDRARHGRPVMRRLLATRAAGAAEVGRAGGEAGPGDLGQARGRERARPSSRSVDRALFLRVIGYSPLFPLWRTVCCVYANLDVWSFSAEVTLLFTFTSRSSFGSSSKRPSPSQLAGAPHDTRHTTHRAHTPCLMRAQRMNTQTRLFRTATA